MAITSMSPAALKALRAEMNEALASVAKKHGLAIEVGNGTYTDATASFKLNIAVSADGEAAHVVRARTDYETACSFYGMKKEWIGRRFQYAGREVELLGLLPKKQKFPLLARETDSKKEILLPTEAVTAILSK